MKKSGQHILVVLLSSVSVIPGIHASETVINAPTLAELANATYAGIEEEPINLSGGSWQGEPYVDGGASRPGVGLVEEIYLAGDLEGDGKQDAAVILWQSSGGTGSFTYLAVMTRTENGISNVDTALIGDRVKFRSWQLVDGKIVIDVLQAGENDAMCCPGTLATRTWTMENNRLMEGQINVTGELSLAALEGTGWLLTHMDRQTPIENAEVTLNVQKGRIGGKSACNHYSADIKGGENAGDIHIGVAMSTRMACPDHLMNIEQAYLDALSRVDSFSFQFGSLALRGQNNDGETFNLLFRPFEAETP